MTFSPELEARFEKFLAKYPADRKRSAMIPMLIYGQDEVGSMTDELIEEVAKRVGVTPLQVQEVLTYYSMLHRKPMGKYHVQICTNISCLLVGGEELWNRASQMRPSAVTSLWPMCSICEARFQSSSPPTSRQEMLVQIWT